MPACGFLSAMFPEILLSDYHYTLPDDRIAHFPMDQRDHARLLVYRNQTISHTHFHRLPEALPADTLLVFNDTRVIHARLHARRASGALIEVLLLEPHQPAEVAVAMQTHGFCVWQCMIGNKKKWRNDEILAVPMEIGGKPLTLRLNWHNRDHDQVALGWDRPDVSLAGLLERAGELPLPPYFGRKAGAEDEIRYQTVYARHDGAVAAPTAGLHFTPAVLAGLAPRGILQAYVTLHVSAGTFMPVKHNDVRLHPMHREQILVHRDTIRALVQANGPIIPVGTTSMRVLESLYWIAVRIQAGEAHPTELSQQYAYEHADASFTLPQMGEILLAYMEAHKLEVLSGGTAIFIVPGYQFRVCKGLITNYHLPETTLILLVAALIGEDWRRVYQSALDTGYRFLSYGDSSLLLP